MQVRFETEDFGDEAASLKAASEGDAPGEADHLWGRVVLDHPGQPPVPIFDDLTTLGMTLCVNVPADLAGDGKALLRLVGWPGEFTFEVRGDSVRVTGSEGEDATFPAEDLIQGLHACGTRLSGFMNELSVTSPQYAFSGQALGEALAAQA